MGIVLQNEREKQIRSEGFSCGMASLLAEMVSNEYVDPDTLQGMWTDMNVGLWDLQDQGLAIEDARVLADAFGDDLAKTETTE